MIRCISIFALLLTSGSLPAAEPVDESQITDSLKKSISYLEKEGRAWFDGEVLFQEEGCVSCHQVPSGLWSAAAAYYSLEAAPGKEYRKLLADSQKFIADPKTGRPASWSQLLISEKAYGQSQDGDSASMFDDYLPHILKSQQDNGAWQAKGQFPSQRRPIEESDAVVTMWMIHALELRENKTERVETSIAKARKFAAGVKGKSTEWLAWRLLLADGDKERETIRERLVKRQHDDGSWSWGKDGAADAYSTGVALFALAKTSPERVTERENAARFLLQRQGDDGSWLTPSKLISKKESDSRDYVYQYWSTAWATLGIAEFRNATK